MTWSLIKPLDLVHDMLIFGDIPNVRVTIYEEKNGQRFREGSVSFEPVDIRLYGP